MLGISGTELAVILLFAFLLFGPDKLPQAGRTIGRALRQFNETRDKLTNVVQTEVVDPMAAAAQAPHAPKKSGATADADDLDADIADAAIDSAARHKETFAERRARLAAERAAREANEASAVDDADAKAADASEPVAAAPTTDASAVAPEPETAHDEAEPEVRTTADLYARRPRKRVADAAEQSDATEKGGEQ